MPDAFVPTDDSARRLIVQRLDENMIVEAGAGTGKTRSLVNRVVALISKGYAAMDRVAAITFTEAAAAELRERIREALESATSDASKDETEHANCKRGLRDLDQAAVQTLHSFAGSILRERPLEAGLPPGFEVLDEIRADLLFDEQWSAWVDSALEDPELIPHLKMSMSLGLSTGHLREIAAAFHNSYDLLKDAVFNEPVMPPVCAAAQLVDARSELEYLCAFAALGDDDPLVMHVREVSGLARRLEFPVAGSLEAYRLLAHGPAVKSGKGNQKNWETDPQSGENACKQLKQLLSDLDADIQEELAQVRTACLVPLLRALRLFALRYAEARRQQGVGEFHDLLVWARDLLRDNIEVRDHFRHRYSHLLIDEMQDTDPLQAEIAMFLAEDAPPGVTPASRPRQWADVRPAPGKLFVVGDPKQSIYRFRRADVTLVARLRQVLGKEPVKLTQNFRSQRPVIEWVNHLFSEWMQPGPGQPEYTPLTHRWEPDVAHPVPPSVHYIGDSIEGAIAEQVRRDEARAIASVISRIRDEQWPVLDEDVEIFRPAQLRDACILMPARNGLPLLEHALEDAGIPYRLESASLVFSTQEVRDLLNCLWAIDNPAEQVALVAALRSPALACSDVDLLSFVEGGGRLDYLTPQNCPVGPVLEALSVLRDFHHRRMWKPPAALIEEFIRERRLMELALDHPRPRERWRRYRFLIDRARAFVSAGGTSLRDFLNWAARQEEEKARMPETAVPEADEDAVRIMTIHGAKGLEFPIVLMAGLNSSKTSQADRVLFDRESGHVEVRVGSSGKYFQTSRYKEQAETEKQRGQEEDVRLMYVAATRARDHLVVSLYRASSKNDSSAAAYIASRLEGAGHLWKQITPAPAITHPQAISPQEAEYLRNDTPETRQAWLDQHDNAFRRQSIPPAVAATTIAQEAREEFNEPAEPWRRGRAGTSLGRAIHAVLQTVDLKTGKWLDETARAQATAEGIPGRHREIAALARRALRSPAVQRALDSKRLWREAPIAAPVGDGILEGFIDLLFEEEDGLVIVDYKTDTLKSEADIDRAMRRYRLQGGAYALALQKATQRRVKEVVFLFLQPEKLVPVENLAAAITEAEKAAIASLSVAADKPAFGYSR